MLTLVLNSCGLNYYWLVGEPRDFDTVPIFYFNKKNYFNNINYFNKKRAVVLFDIVCT